MNYLLPFALLCMLFSGCALTDEVEPQPSYLHISDIKLVDNPDIEEGSLDDDIVAVILNANGVRLGIFSLPATIPVLETGDVTFQIDPLVKLNGVSRSLALYPFYDRMTPVITMEAGRTDTVVLETQYSSISTATFLEDFDDGVHQFVTDIDGQSASRIEALPGGRTGLGGVITLSPDVLSIEVATPSSPFLGLKRETRTWLEVTAKTELEIRFGLIINEPGFPQQPLYLFGILPSQNDEWRKLYFDLSEYVLGNPRAFFQLSLLGFYVGEQDGPDKQIILDNIKIVQF